jgi:MFS family permease
MLQDAEPGDDPAPLLSDSSSVQPGEPSDESTLRKTLRARWLGATFRSLAHRNYRLYFFGQLISLTGTWMQNAALTWLAFEITGQSKWPALLTACQLFPTFLFGAWGGSIADRIPKRPLLVVTQSAMLILALALAALVAMRSITPWQMLVISLANGVIVAIDLPARLAFVVEMVGRDDLINAVALNSLLFNAARIIGPALAGILLVSLGATSCFLVNAGSYLAVLWALLEMTIPPRPQPPSSHHAGSLRAGLAYLIQRPNLAVLVLLAGVLAICGWPTLALMPGLAKKTLGTAAQGYTAMVSAVGIGALAAALPVATFGSMARRRAFIGTGLCSVTLALFGLCMAASLSFAIACCALLGFGLILFLSTSQAAVQLGAADYNRGLLMGIWAMVQSGGVPLGNLLTGPAADRWGESTILLIQGSLCALASGGLAGSFLILKRFNTLAQPPSS